MFSAFMGSSFNIECTGEGVWHFCAKASSPYMPDCIFQKSSSASTSTFSKVSCNCQNVNELLQAYRVALIQAGRQAMQQYMEHEWPKLYEHHHHVPLLNDKGEIRLPSGVRANYAALCARAVLYFEHASGLAENPCLGQQNI